MTLGSCPQNSVWVRAACGEEGLRQLADRPISCCGTTIGSVACIKEYLQKMTAALARLSIARPLHTEWGLMRIDTAMCGVEQALHNYIVYKEPPRGLCLMPNEEGPVMTVGYKKPETLRFNNLGQVLNAKGDVVHVLHQYDRHKALTAHLHQTLGLSPPAQP
jgi:hypothetical protein